MVLAAKGVPTITKEEIIVNQIPKLRYQRIQFSRLSTEGYERDILRRPNT